MSYVHNPGYLDVEQGLISSSDKTKVAQLHFKQPANSNVTLSLPNQTTDLVGHNTSDFLTNKTITSTTNTVTANSLRTQNGSLINVSNSNPTTSGQILVTSTTANANWVTPGQTFFYNGNTVATPSISILRQWHGVASTSNGEAIFNVTTTGTAGGLTIFTSLTNCYMQATARMNTSDALSTPLVSIRSVTGDQVVVSVVIGTVVVLASGSTMRFNTGQTVQVYLSVFGF